MFDYHALAPELIIGGTLLVALLADLVLPENRKYLVGVIGLVGLAAALLPLLTVGFCDDLPFCEGGAARVMFGGSYVVDDFALVLKGLFVLTGIISVLMSVAYIESDRYYQGEFYFLIIASVLGAVIMASSRDLITLFIGLELVSGPAFLLAGWRKGDVRSNEASLKFFLIGVLSAAILLFGMSLVYGLTGEITFEGIRVASAGLSEEPAFILGVIFILVGFGFKIAAVPFHFWAPDTYQGAPTPVAAYLSVGSKAAGFVGLLTICYLAFANVADIWGPVLWILAVLSMTIGNLTALKQTNIVRLLGYSSIAHAGFVLVPFAMAAAYDAEGLESAFSASITYLLFYAFMNLGAFAVVIAGAEKAGSAEIDDWAGLSRYAPGLASLLGIFFFSLAGIPPLAGWFAKFVMFRSVMGGGAGAWGVALAVIAAVNAVVALYYYARVVKTAFMDPVPATAPLELAARHQTAPALALVLGITAAVVIVAGFYPPILSFFGDAARVLSFGG
ncbi:MAG: NADH-quinone oxidoreductase subunit N [Actinobacteria bacterium]|nr:NADH-quinone oxidoreductase subunit N [Actinomycetota bacterium]MBU1494544.1 NADH-quinone oxidoreductase subunit N [Actinomycetota bacterium]